MEREHDFTHDIAAGAQDAMYSYRLFNEGLYFHDLREAPEMLMAQALDIRLFDQLQYDTSQRNRGNGKLYHAEPQ